MRMTKGKVLHIIRKHQIAQVLHDIKIKDGMPEGCILYGVSKDEAYWTVRIP